MRKTSESGFTLVEVLASLVIFSIAILGLMHAGAENIKAVQLIEQKQVAGIIADNQLILAQTDERGLRVGTSQETVEMNGQKWDWDLRVEETDLDGFLRLVVNVREENQDRILISRTAFADVTAQE
ncbi:MAG: type II secretion system minor pseudopilin GspI [Hyphomonadaceae bacterium]|nr:type II secretion system minor pseudopilin GspI [Hyphomonadaceae bacterium]